MKFRLCRHAFAVSFAFCWVLPAVAEEPRSAALLQTLPADGDWATYNVTVYAGDQEFTVTSTARSVGKVSYGGKPCRFVEYEQTADAPPAFPFPQLGNLTWRALVPEEEFGEGKDPIGKAVKKWVKYDTMTPEIVESIEQKDPFFAILFQGPKKNLKTEEGKEKVVWQRGQLECPVVAGQSNLELGLLKLDLTHRVFRNNEVPFGVAGVRGEMKFTLGNTTDDVVIRATLRDHGKDAKPKLPNLVP